jgi:hypothetical protein
MPRLVNKIPRYGKHRASSGGHSSGQEFYLGPHGTKGSHLEYDCVVAEWLARSRQPIVEDGSNSCSLTVVELLAAYKGEATSKFISVSNIAKAVVRDNVGLMRRLLSHLRCRRSQCTDRTIDWCGIEPWMPFFDLRRLSTGST